MPRCWPLSCYNAPHFASSFGCCYCILSQQFQKSLNWLWDNSSCCNYLFRVWHFVGVVEIIFIYMITSLLSILKLVLPSFPPTHTHTALSDFCGIHSQSKPHLISETCSASFALRVQVRRKWFLRIPLFTLILKSDTDSSICFAAFNHLAVHGIAFFPQHSNKFISLTFAVPSILEDAGRKCYFCFFLPSPRMTTDFLYLSSRFLDEGMHGTVKWPTRCFHSSKGRARWTRARNQTTPILASSCFCRDISKLLWEKDGSNFDRWLYFKQCKWDRQTNKHFFSPQPETSIIKFALALTKKYL